MRTNPIKTLRLFIFLAILVTTSSPLIAAIQVWDGSASGNWNNSANWENNAVPQNGDELVFPPQFLRTTTTNNFNPPLLLGAIRFSGSNYVVRGNELRIAKGILSDQKSGGNSIDCRVRLDAPQAIVVARADARLTLRGLLDLKGSDITFRGEGEINMDDSIIGIGSVIKEGGGTLAYRGTLLTTSANRYTGRTEVLRGTLLLQNVSSEGGARPSIPGPLIVGSSTPLIGKDSSGKVRLSAPNQIAAGIPLTLRRFGEVDLNGSDATFGEVSFEGGGKIATGSGLMRCDGIGVVPASGFIVGLRVPPPSISGRLNYGSGTRFMEVANIALGSDLEISAVVSGSGVWAKTGGGEVALSGDNLYSGETSVRDGSILVLHNRALGAPDIRVSVNAGAALRLENGRHVVDKPLRMNAAQIGSDPAELEAVSGVNAWDGAVQFIQGNLLQTGNPVFVVQNGSELALRGSISGVPGFDKTGEGTLTLAGGQPNSQAGPNRVIAGSLLLAKTIANSAILQQLIIGSEADQAPAAAVIRTSALEQLDNSTRVTVNRSGTFRLEGSFETIGRLEGAGRVEVTSLELRTGGSGQNSVFTGTITGSGGLQKQGAGVMTLTGRNTYTGVTRIQQGTLEIDGTQPESEVSVGPVAVLRGTGRIGALTVQSGGTVWPGGDALGTLTTTRALLQDGAILKVRIAKPSLAASDRLASRSTAILNGSGLQANLQPGLPLAPSDLFQIVDTPSGVTGTFDRLPNGAELVVDNTLLEIRYPGFPNNSVILRVPRPQGCAEGTLDLTPPILTCPPDLVRVAGAELQYAVENFTAIAGALDDCGAPIVVQSPVAGTVRGLGAHTITLRATDGAGNHSECTFTVNVVSPGVFLEDDVPFGPGDRVLTSRMQLLPGEPLAQAECWVIYSTDRQAVAQGQVGGSDPHGRASMGAPNSEGISTCEFIFPHNDHMQPNAIDRNPLRIAAGQRVHYRLVKRSRNTETISEIREFVMPLKLTIGLFGDSYAAGEGAPDYLIPALGALPGNTVWLNPPAHRSRFGGFAMAAEELKRTSPRTAFLVKNVTCSGAKITEGMLFSMTTGPQSGRGACLGPADPEILEPQLKQMHDYLTEREGYTTPEGLATLNIAVMHIGGNDVGFAEIVFRYFLLPLNLLSDLPPTPSDRANLDFNLNQLLPELLQDLHEEFKEKFSYDCILLAETPNLLRRRMPDGDLVYCGGFNPGFGSCWRDLEALSPAEEFAWAEQNILRPLNNVRERTINSFPKWQFVRGLSELAEAHGLCNCDEPYFNTLGQSLHIQGDPCGIIHPNRAGYNNTYRPRILAELKQAVLKIKKESARDQLKERVKERLRQQIAARNAKNHVSTLLKPQSVGDRCCKNIVELDWYQEALARAESHPLPPLLDNLITPWADTDYEDFDHARKLGAEPRLDVHVSNNRISLSWPEWASELGLESSDNLRSGWTPVRAMWSSEFGRRQIEVEPADGRKFFRLKGGR